MGFEVAHVVASEDFVWAGRPGAGVFHAGGYGFGHVEDEVLWLEAFVAAEDAHCEAETVADVAVHGEWARLEEIAWHAGCCS